MRLIMINWTKTSLESNLEKHRKKYRVNTPNYKLDAIC